MSVAFLRGHRRGGKGELGCQCSAFTLCTPGTLTVCYWVHRLASWGPPVCATHLTVGALELNYMHVLPCQDFAWVMGIQTCVLRLAWQVLHPLSHLLISLSLEFCRFWGRAGTVRSGAKGVLLKQDDASFTKAPLRLLLSHIKHTLPFLPRFSELTE